LKVLKCTKSEILDIVQKSPNIEHHADSLNHIRMKYWEDYIPCKALQTKYDQLQRDYGKLFSLTSQSVNIELTQQYQWLLTAHNKLLRDHAALQMRYHVIELQLKQLQQHKNNNNDSKTSSNGKGCGGGGCGGCSSSKN